MAQVSNVTLTIGTKNVGPELSIPGLVPAPPDTRQYRLVTVSATLNFAPPFYAVNTTTGVESKPDEVIFTYK